MLLGGGVKIYDTDFHWLNYERRINVAGGSKPVVIKKGAFIGAHSLILKGVTVGEKSIVGVGSVVTKSVPDGEIWAGNPARFIRKIDDPSPDGLFYIQTVAKDENLGTGTEGILERFEQGK